MFRLGIIGTSAIASENITAALDTGLFTLEVVYSRKETTARAFAQQFNVSKIETNLEAFVKREDIDAIYIASPNSLHFEQTCLALNAKKHVILEKPAFLSRQQWDVAHQIAADNQVLIIDAIRHVYEDNFKKVYSLIRSWDSVDSAVFQFQQYSSRLESLESGNIPNVFSLDFGGGALMDLGVYAIYAAIMWFGRPIASRYEAQKMLTGVDGGGMITLKYADFTVYMHISKMHQTYAPSEIFSKQLTLEIPTIDRIENVVLHDHKKKENIVVAPSNSASRMNAQWIHFNEVLSNGETQWMKEIKVAGSIVMDTLDALRQSAGIVFTNE